MRYRVLLNLILSILLSLLTACSTFTPKNDYQQQTQKDIAQVENWQPLSNSVDVGYLTDLFDSSDVDSLLTQAFEANPSFQQTLLTLEMKRVQLKQTAADQRPQLTASLSGSKQEDSNASYNSSLTVSWQADLWGKLQASTNAAKTDIAEQEMLVQSARDSLGADILQAWLELISQKRAIDIQQRRIETLQQNESFILQRYRNGLGTLADRDSAMTSTASARATLSSNQQQFDLNLQNLKSLLGQLSPMEVTIPNIYPDVAIPSASFPEKILGQRPDLKAAYLAIQSAQLRTEVAYKELLPSLNLQAMLENTATTIGDSLFVSPVWSLLGQLTAPIYKGGQLRADAEIAELNSAYAYQSYKEKLLAAVVEVENYITQEQSITTRLTYLTTALQSANNNLANYQQSYRTGLVNILELLSVQQQTYDLESQINDATFSLLSNRISLGLALALEIKS